MTVPKATPTDQIGVLLSGYQNPEYLVVANGLLKQLAMALVERALEAEMTEYLGHGKHEAASNPTGNTRNGKSRKTLKGDLGESPLEIPRDRQGQFVPQILSKHQSRWTAV